MRIVLFHPVSLPPKDYGGVERVVLWLARGLTEAGHEVWVAAREGSTLPPGARLISMQEGKSSAVDLLPKLPAGVDVVHFMAPPEAEALSALPCAALLTVHGNGKPGERFLKNTVFLSRDHASRHGAQVFVHNGVDPTEYKFAPETKEDRFLFLSKTSWRVKNVAGAVSLCAKAGQGLRVAGGNRPLGVRAKVALRSFGLGSSGKMSWEGPVAGQVKAGLLARARGLVFPIRWPEPFGLVVVEALISGTPVLASRLGSLPELVGPEVGRLLPPPVSGGSESAAEAERAWLAALTEKPWPFDPAHCRKWALERFTHRKMAERYADLYRKVAAGESLHEVAPQSVPSKSSGDQS